MSLKHFHLFFISCSLTLMVYVLTWTRSHSSPGCGAAAFFGAAAGAAYLAWFLRRYKTLS